MRNKINTELAKVEVYPMITKARSLELSIIKFEEATEEFGKNDLTDALVGFKKDLTEAQDSKFYEGITVLDDSEVEHVLNNDHQVFDYVGFTNTIFSGDSFTDYFEGIENKFEAFLYSESTRATIVSMITEDSDSEIEAERDDLEALFEEVRVAQKELFDEGLELHGEVEGIIYNVTEVAQNI